MQFCKQHWKSLQDTVKAKGMFHLVKDHKTVQKRMKDEIADKATDDTYCPLFDCHFMITEKALALGGPYLMQSPPEGGHYCPLCELDKHKDLVKSNSAEWIDGVTEAVLDYCKEKNLLRLSV
jgi:hypothetical protein